MRAWLLKQKKKEEAKNTPQVATPPALEGSTTTDAQPTAEAAEKPVESIEGASKTEDADGQQVAPAGENVGDAGGSALPQTTEVGCSYTALYIYLLTIAEFSGSAKRRAPAADESRLTAQPERGRGFCARRPRWPRKS